MCNNLTKSYKKEKIVKQIQLKFKENSICGLLGRNGSGKTTILNMISGHSFYDKGNIYVKGKLLLKGCIHQDICYVKDRQHFFWNQTVMEVLKIASSFYQNWDWKAASALLEEFSLDPAIKCRKLSRGMETMVGIIIGMASRAPITIFDEPDAGLDSVMREKFYSLLLEDYTEYPRTIIISTHLVDECAKLLEKIYVIDSGEVILEENIDELRSKMYSLYGERDQIDRFIENKDVLHVESVGNKKIVNIFHPLSSEDIYNLEKSDVSVGNLSVQHFLTQLLERKKNH
ncbi:ABC transporter ATP-binding protein [Bacillus atrophaeus]|uniref:ATP-binding cassette domain-containing protein n=1 Tax=Bacillus atrophaeus TaxID=1452 RepID=UPI0022824F13|nr:ABC transporter ATP-binding protein [Bacillus atrophaeus]MCY8515912.1 ABC transporter ATP-binding protein [Bacillus atrophaeus]